MKTRLIVLVGLFPLALFSQQVPEVKFGKISVSDLEKRIYQIDTAAHAVVLYDIGSTQIIGNKKGWFSLEFKRKTRIHILNKNAYGFATVEIPIYTIDDLEEELTDIKAATYNLENGKVVDYRLEKSAVFKEKRNKNLVIKKFTLPAVKEGSIIEYEYKLTSDFLFNLQPWAFQSELPNLWSEYKVGLPQFLKYILIYQGDQNYTLRDQKDLGGNYEVNTARQTGFTTIDDRINISCGKTEFRWALKDAAPFKKEVYTSSIGNYVKKLEFQLAGYDEPLTPQAIMTNWPDVSRKLREREDFGLQLDNIGNWLSSIVASLTQGKSSATDKAKLIYEYIRDNLTCIDHSQLYTEKSLKDVFQNKNGGVAEINLLLIAMLREAGINSNPVILSTRDNGFVYEKYPIIGRFNYVVCSAELDGGNVLLDATTPLLGFAKLNTDAYNGQARIINEAATAITLHANQLTEKEIIVVNLTSDNKTWLGKIEHLSGYYESLTIRQQVKAKGQSDFFEKLTKNFGNETKISHYKIDSLNNFEQPVKLNYTISFNTEQGDVIYFDPVITGRYSHNPFKSEDRKYAVEMPYKISETYMLNLSVPEDYGVDEMPKTILIKMPDNSAVFEYIIALSDGIVRLRCKLELNKAKFESWEYNALRDFFNKVAAKQNELIVFKKK